MRTTLEIDDDVMEIARELANAESRSVGAIVSDLARRGLTPSRVVYDGEFPVIVSPPGSPPITPEMVRRALEDE